MLLGIDPGPTETAFVLWDGQRIVDKGKVANETLGEDFFVQADRVAIEMIASYGMAVGREVFETCVWIGRFIERVPQPAIIRLIYRVEVKMHLCHSTKANDSNIRQALIDKIGPVGRKKTPGPCFGVSGDIWQALGVAVTAWETKPKEQG